MSGESGDAVSIITSADRELPKVQYEYLDHPADVQLHAWGDSLDAAFEQVTIAMFAYMTDISTVSIESHIDVEVEGLDMQSLLYQMMDEFLFHFSAEPFFIPRVS
jgi:SHS2 domain-containing protein